MNSAKLHRSPSTRAAAVVGRKSETGPRGHALQHVEPARNQAVAKGDRGGRGGEGYADAYFLRLP